MKQRSITTHTASKPGNEPFGGVVTNVYRIGNSADVVEYKYLLRVKRGLRRRERVELHRGMDTIFHQPGTIRYGDDVKLTWKQDDNGTCYVGIVD